MEQSPSDVGSDGASVPGDVAAGARNDAPRVRELLARTREVEELRGDGHVAAGTSRETRA
jgi:hypothetical protein